MRPTLTVNYQTHATTYLAPPLSASNSISDSSCSLSLFGSTSSTGSTSDPSPPISPIRTTFVDKAHIKVGSSPVRPSLRHLPSWQSFASHRSRRSGMAADSGEDEAFDDAPDEGVWEKRPAFGRTKEPSTGSMRSSRKGRFGFRRRDVVVECERERLDTPWTLPTLPRPYSRSTPCPLATMDVNESNPASPDGSPDPDADGEIDEFFTPGPIPASSSPSTATLLLTLIPAPKPAMDALRNAVTDTSLDFNLDIFSPRIPPAPTLCGIMDALPISPLELPSPDVGRPSMMAVFARHHFPTPVIPRNPASSPVVSAAADHTMPSFGGIAAELGFSSPKPRLESLSPRRSSVRSPKTTTSPYTSGRRLSAIIRPPILPTPTPPSLLSSPRSLATPILPAVASPSRKGSPSRSGGYSSLNHMPYITDPSTKRRRPSRAVLSLPTSGSLGGLGFGVIGTSQAGDAESKKHVATPGTFGLEGEAERRLITEGVNPYFA